MSPPYPIGLTSRNHDQRAVRFCSNRINLRCIDFATRRQGRSEAPGHGRSIANLSPVTGRRPESAPPENATSDNWSYHEWRYLRECCGCIVQHLSPRLSAPARMLREHVPVLAAQIVESLANYSPRYGGTMVLGADCNLCNVDREVPPEERCSVVELKTDKKSNDS
jgi:hypothetical protein